MDKYVDNKLGISTMGGYENIYNKFISAFVENNRNLISDITSLLVGYKSEARRLVHSIKGVALNLSSQRLSDSATQFEKAIMDEDKNLIIQSFEDFKAIFNVVMDELKDYLKTLE